MTLKKSKTGRTGMFMLRLRDRGIDSCNQLARSRWNRYLAAVGQASTQIPDLPLACPGSSIEVTSLLSWLCTATEGTMGAR
jgi:hypothetical protein